LRRKNARQDMSSEAGELRARSSKKTPSEWGGGKGVPKGFSSPGMESDRGGVGCGSPENGKNVCVFPQKVG